MTFDASSTLPVVAFSFTGNEVWINVAGEFALAGTRAILDVEGLGWGRFPNRTAAVSLGLLALAVVRRFQRLRR